MLLLHTDVFLTTREVVLQRAFGELRAGPGPPQIAAAVLLHRDPLFSKSYFFFLFLNQVVFTPLGLLGIRLEGGGWNGVGGRGGGREGGRRGKGEGGCVQGEVDKPRAQCLPRISKNVPLERSHTRHGRNQCAPSHTYTCLIYIHEQATNDRVRTVGGCHRLLGSPRLIWIDGSGSRGAGDCARHHPFIDISPSHHS